MANSRSLPARHTRFFSKWIVAAICGWCGLSAAQTQKAQCLGDPQAKTVYQFSVVPQLPQGELYAYWSPILEKIGRAEGWCFNLYLQPSIPEFETELISGRLDFAFANPYHLIMANKSAGYVPLLADAGLLSGIIVVRKDSKVQRIDNLDGQTLAFPAPNAFAASLLPRALLNKAGVRIQPQYVKTHSNVYRSILQGDVVAGGGVNNTLMREPEGLRQQLRVLYETPGFLSHPIVVHPRVTEAARTRFQTIFMKHASQADQQANFNKIQMPNPRQVNLGDYEALTHLGVERFVSSSH